VGIPTDPTFTVSQTNDRWAIVLSMFAAATVGGACWYGSFGARLNVFVNSWVSLNQICISYLIGYTDTKTGWWRFLIVLLHVGLGIAGSAAGAAQVSAVFGGASLSPYLVPTFGNSVPVGWAILTSASLYLFFLHVFVICGTYNRSPGDAAYAYAMAYFVFGVPMYFTTRLTPNFALNVAIRVFTGVSDVLWIDVIGAVIAIILTLILWRVLWWHFFNADVLGPKYRKEDDQGHAGTYAKSSRNRKPQAALNVAPDTNSRVEFWQ